MGSGKWEVGRHINRDINICNLQHLVSGVWCLVVCRVSRELRLRCGCHVFHNGAGINRLTDVWVGVPEELVQEDFAKKFHKQVHLTGHIYMWANGKEIADYFKLVQRHRRSSSFQSVVIPDDLD